MNTKLIEELAAVMLAGGHKLASAESCTGGWVAKCVTDLAGSSDWFDMSVVSYSNEAKHRVLRVSELTLREYGAVSEQTVREMVDGVLQVSAADVAVAVSGIAGPGGGSDDKPVGTVWFAWQLRGACSISEAKHFRGDREEVRRQAVEFALRGVLRLIEKK